MDKANGQSENVIVLAGTRWQIPLIQRLKEKGYKVIVFNLLSDSPAFAYADEYCIVDITDKEKCFQLAVKYAPKAIMSDECDIAVPTIAFLSERMGLESIGMEMGELYTDKYKMRVFGQRYGFDTPLFYKCRQLSDAIRAFKSFGRKMIMKPLDANSSRGVYSINSEDDVRLYFEDTLSFSKKERNILLEEYIEGTEFTVDGIKTANGHISLAISEKKHYSYNENIACSLYFSYKNTEYDYDGLREINNRFVELSGLPFGLTHAEYKYRGGKYYLMEIGARGGGNLISACIVPLVSGVDVYDYLIDKALGKNCRENITVSKKNMQRCAALMFFDTNGREGVVKEIEGEDYLMECRNIVDYAVYCKKGDHIVNASDDSKRIGYYIAYGENAKELDHIIHEVKTRFRIVLQRL